MNLSDKINIIVAVINSLVFIVMLIALILQRKTIRQTQKEFEITYHGLKIQILSNLLSQKINELNLIDKNSSMGAQESYNIILNEIGEIKKQIKILTNKFE